MLCSHTCHKIVLVFHVHLKRKYKFTFVTSCNNSNLIRSVWTTEIVKKIQIISDTSIKYKIEGFARVCVGIINVKGIVKGSFWGYISDNWNLMI